MLAGWNEDESTCDLIPQVKYHVVWCPKMVWFYTSNDTCAIMIGVNWGNWNVGVIGTLATLYPLNQKLNMATLY